MASLLAALLSAPASVVSLASLGSLAGLAVLESPAEAQEAPSATTQAEAKGLFMSGVKASKAGSYQEALAAFIESNRLVPREGTLRNIIKANRDLKDNAAAYAGTESLLALYGTKMAPAGRAEAEQVLQELALLTGVVHIGVQEPGAKINVDGKDMGMTPATKVVRLNMGGHGVAITKEGFEAIKQQVEFSPGHNDVSIDGPLVKEVFTGHVNVTALPVDPTTKILVDGREVGAAPWQGDLDPGPHTIQARSASSASDARPVDVERKGSYEVNLSLHAQGGTISVTVNTDGAEISIDGRVVAEGAYQQAAISAGRHLLSVYKAGYAPYKKDLVVTDGEKVVESVALSLGNGGPMGPHDWKGLYEQLNFIVLFGVNTPQNDITKGTGYNLSPTMDGSQSLPGVGITDSKAIGGAIDLTVGYNFGWWGLEGALLFGLDHSAAQAKVFAPQNSAQHPQLNTNADMSGVGPDNPPNTPGTAYPYTEKYDFYHLGGDLTVGARFLPKIQGVRPTVGVGGGLAVKAACYNRGVTAQSGADNTVGCSFATYVAPAIRADVGVEIGQTPNTRFYLGVLFLGELGVKNIASPVSATTAGADVNFPNPQINVVTGSEFYIGPMLGMQFGE